MPSEDPDSTWKRYYERKKAERLSEAVKLAAQMRADGVSDETVVALDFTCFGSSESRVQGLATQLSENYTVSVTPSQEAGYWLAYGTTRPYGITSSSEEHYAWVGFLADAAQSHGCVFSTWSLEAPKLGKKWSSEEFEGDG
jgi:hypothetical protein